MLLSLYRTTILKSPLVPNETPVTIPFREYGRGFPIVHLHGGWGYEMYPMEAQIEALQDRYKLVIPDRTGYGKAIHMTSFPVDFHDRAATETISVLNSLRLERSIIWGHSDGAVIAAWLGLLHPERFAGIIFEAFHYYKVKSKQFFEDMAARPESAGDRVGEILAKHHGPEYWKRVISMDAQAWLDIAAGAKHPKEDLYGGKLKDLKVPCIFLHGSRDPRTEPDELEAVERELPGTLRVIEGAGHCPHNENGAAAESTRIALEFIDSALAREPKD